MTAAASAPFVRLQQSLIGRYLKLGRIVPPGGVHQLHHADHDNVFYRIDPEDGTGSATPTVCPGTADHSTGCGVDQHAESKAKTRSIQTRTPSIPRLFIQGWLFTAGAALEGGAKVVSRHVGHGFGAQDAHTVQFAMAHGDGKPQVVPQR